MYTVPEAATVMFGHGAAGEDFGKEGFSYYFQVALIRLQMRLEETFETLGRATGMPCVVVADRGLMDGRAYMEEGEWRGMVDELRLGTDVDIREGR